MKIDLHIHTKYSKDCRLEPERIVRAAKLKGLGAVAITDHGTLKGGVDVKKLKVRNFEVIVGSEVMTERGEVIGYFLNEEIKSKSLQEVIDEIRAQDGIVCIPHPFDIFRGSSLHADPGLVKNIDAIEVFNSRCVLNRSNEKARGFAERYGLPMTAGSDAHTQGEIGRAGIIVNQGDDLRKEILNGEVFGRPSSILVHVSSTLTKLLK